MGQHGPTIMGEIIMVIRVSPILLTMIMIMVSLMIMIMIMVSLMIMTISLIMSSPQFTSECALSRSRSNGSSCCAGKPANQCDEET